MTVTVIITATIKLSGMITTMNTIAAMGHKIMIMIHRTAASEGPPAHGSGTSFLGGTCSSI